MRLWIRRLWPRLVFEIWKQGTRQSDMFWNCHFIPLFTLFTFIMQGLDLVAIGQNLRVIVTDQFRGGIVLQQTGTPKFDEALVWGHYWIPKRRNSDPIQEPPPHVPIYLADTDVPQLLSLGNFVWIVGSLKSIAGPAHRFVAIVCSTCSKNLCYIPSIFHIS